MYLTVFLWCVGIDLSSRPVARQVFSALQSLTSVFGMGTGGPSASISPTFCCICSSPQLATVTEAISCSLDAPSGIRTRDPLIKSQLLYQLS